MNKFLKERMERICDQIRADNVYNEFNHTFLELCDEIDRLCFELPEPKLTHQHFKGGRYQFLCEATDEATGKPVVVYRSLKNNTLWVRQKAVWDEVVQTPEGLVQRFKKVDIDGNV